jgi:hypothetical protein
VIAQHRGGEAGLVALGAGVELAADILDRFGDLPRRAPARALEHHMLEQVGKAVEPLLLVPRADVGEQAMLAVSSPASAG